MGNKWGFLPLEAPWEQQHQSLVHRQHSSAILLDWPCLGPAPVVQRVQCCSILYKAAGTQRGRWRDTIPPGCIPPLTCLSSLPHTLSPKGRYIAMLFPKCLRVPSQRQLGGGVVLLSAGQGTVVYFYES